MSNHDLFQTNLLLLSQSNPSLAQQLRQIPPPSHWTACQTNGEDNLNRKEESKTVYLRNPEGGLEEAQIIEQSDLKNTDVIYFYGIGLGYPYEAILSWLNQRERRSLVFLEDDLEVLYFFLQTSRAEALLRDPRVEIFYIPNFTSNPSMIRKITSDNALRNFSIGALPFYRFHKTKTLAALQDALVYHTTEQDIQNRELAALGSAFFHNFYPNLLQLPDSYHVEKFAQRFKNIPAIICGAGPSLTKQLPYLKELNQRAVLFAPGSSLNILSYHGLRPHFGVNIDPNPETFHRQIMNRAYDIPIFYRNRIYWEALTTIHGPRLWIPGAVFYNIAPWFEKQLGLPSLPFEGGYNVAFTAIEMAHYMGCNPVILVGMDLSFQTGQHYAEGVERHPLFPGDTTTECHLGPPIEVIDIHGQRVWSYWPWLAESQLASIYAQEHPELKLINATEKGIGFYSIPNIPLKQIMDESMTTIYDLEQMVHDAIQEAGSTKIEKQKIGDCIEKLYHSLCRCETLCMDILDTINARKTKNTTEPSVKEECKSFEELLRQETGYEAILGQFNDFYLEYLQKDLRILNRNPNPSHRFQLSLKYYKQRYHFLLHLTQMNLHIIEVTMDNAAKSTASEKKYPQEQPLLQERDSEKLLYYPSGALFSKRSTSSSQQDESYLSYYEDGTIKSELHYHKGMLSGAVHLYFPSGAPKRVLHFIDGQREGLEQSWYDNGQLFTEVEYHQNKPLRARCWSEEGALLREITC